MGVNRGKRRALVVVQWVLALGVLGHAALLRADSLDHASAAVGIQAAQQPAGGSRREEFGLFNAPRARLLKAARTEEHEADPMHVLVRQLQVIPGLTGPCNRFPNLCGDISVGTCINTGVSTYVCTCSGSAGGGTLGSGTYYDHVAKKCFACSQPSAYFTTRFLSCPYETANYEGCYLDTTNSSRLVPVGFSMMGDQYTNITSDNPFLTNYGLTLSSCATLAVTADFNIFSTQNGVNCFGGKNMALAKALGQSDNCTSRCMGDMTGTQKCGGPNSNSLYSFSYKPVCTSGITAAGNITAGNPGNSEEFSPSLADCRRKCSLRSSCTFVIFNGTICAFRTNFLTGIVGTNGVFNGTGSSIVCPIRPTDDNYHCVQSYDTKGTLAAALTVANKAACKERCNALRWSCTHFTFVSGVPNNTLNCFLKSDLLKGAYGNTRADVGMETCAKVAEKSDVCGTSPSPCGDPGTFTACIPGKEADNVTDSWTNWTCACASGYYFNTTMKRCLPANCVTGNQPCGEGGTCTNINSTSYSCTCKKGYFFEINARMCLQNRCTANSTNPCGTAKTTISCIPNGWGYYPPSGPPVINSGYTCTCKTGYYNNNGKCEPSLCTTDPSPCGPAGTWASCSQQSPSSFWCSCGQGYTFDPFVTKTCFRDPCLEVPNPCSKAGFFTQCTGYANGTYTCACTPGYFYDAKKGTCIKTACNKPVNPCGSKNGTICISSSATTYNCTCPESYVYDSYTKSCQSDPCFLPDAACGGAEKYSSCVPFNGTKYTCNCKPGYYFDSAAQTCKTDPCTLSPSPCGTSDAFARCSIANSSLGYSCTCRAGFSFNGTACVRAAVDLGACASRPCGNNTASRRCTAISGTDMYLCTCNSPAFLFDSSLNGGYGTCAENPCARAQNPCGAAGAYTLCTALSSTDWKCNCANGYFFDPVDRTCRAGSCATTPSLCGAPGAYSSCNPIGTNDYNCTCSRRFWYSTDAKTCLRNMCVGPTNPCGAGSICTPTGNATYSCSCPSGQAFDQISKRCAGDKDPPVLTTPSAVVAEAATADGATVFYTATAYDIQSGSLTPTCVPASGSLFPVTGAGPGTLVVCTATDGAKNTVTKSFRVMVVDTTPPFFEPIPDIALESTDPDGMVVYFDDKLKYSDTISNVSVTCTNSSGSFFPVGEVVSGVCNTAYQDPKVTTSGPLCTRTEGGAIAGVQGTRVTCTASDRAGNKAVQSFTITVVKPTPPYWVAIPSFTTWADATDADGAVVNYTIPTATDAMNPTNIPGPGLTNVSCSPPPGTKFPIGAFSVTCKAVDALGNEATITLTTIVACMRTSQYINGTAETDSGNLTSFDDVLYTTGVRHYIINGIQASVGDYVNGIQSVLSFNGINAYQMPWRGGYGNLSVSARLNDSTDMIVAAEVGAERYITSIRLTSRLGQNITVAASTQGGTPVSAGPADLPACAPPGATRRLFALKGSYMNMTDGRIFLQSLAFVWLYEKGSSLALPDDMYVEAPSSDGAYVSFSVAATKDAPFVCQPASGSLFPVGNTTVTCRIPGAVPDAPSDIGSFNVVVGPPTPPVFSLGTPSVIRVDATSPQGAAVRFANNITATDVFSGPPMVTCDPPSNTFFPVGDTTVTCTAVDRIGLKATINVTITVLRNSSIAQPTLTVPANLTVEGTPGASRKRVTYNVTTSNDVPFVCTPYSDDWFPQGQVTNVTCSLVGYDVSAWFLVTVAEPEPPVFVAPPVDVILDANVPWGAVYTFYNPGMAKDALSGPPVIQCEPPSGFTFPYGNTTVTCTATDQVGMTANVTFLVSVRNPCASAVSPCGASGTFTECRNVGLYDFSCTCAAGYSLDNQNSCSDSTQEPIYILTSVGDNQCLDATGGVLAQRTCANTGAQSWTFIETGGSAYAICNGETRCITASATPPASDALLFNPYDSSTGFMSENIKLGIRDPNGAPNQRFYLRPIYPKGYTLSPVLTPTKCITVMYNLLSPGTPLVLADCPRQPSETNAQNVFLLPVAPNITSAGNILLPYTANIMTSIVTIESGGQVNQQSLLRWKAVFKGLVASVWQPYNATIDESDVNILAGNVNGTTVYFGDAVDYRHRSHRLNRRDLLQAQDAVRQVAVKIGFTVTWPLAAYPPDETVLETALNAQITAHWDTVKPVFDPYQSVLRPSAPVSGDSAVVDFPAITATDDFYVSAPVTCDPPSGSSFGLGASSVVCKAVDGSGLYSTITLSVQVP